MGTAPKQNIRRSPFELEAKLVLVAACAVLLGLFASWLIERATGWTTHDGRILRFSVMPLLLLTWGLASVKLWLNWRKYWYEYTDVALIVHGRMAMFGKAEAVYRYETIVGVYIKQSLLGRLLDYGDIHLSAAAEAPHGIVLRAIDAPKQHLALLRALTEAK